MKAKFYLYVLAIVFIAAGCNKVKPEPIANIPTNPPAAQINQSPDDFIKQSAAEVGDPAGENTKKAEKAVAVISPLPNPPHKREGIDSKCIEENTQSFDCYQKYYQELVKIQGVVEAFIDLKIRYPANAYIKSQCHPLTHVIGNAAVELYPQVATAYTKGDSFCWSGYYHGVLEGYMAKIGKANLTAQINGICDNIPGKAQYTFDYYNCVHGLGHGVMAMTNTELFESLELCDNLTGNWEQSSCWSGVFMENVIVDNKNHFTKYLKPGEPLYPCTAVNDKYKSTCYLMQTSYMLKVTGGDFTKVFYLCGQVQENFRATCFQSLGRDASGRSVSNAAATRATCDLGQNFEAKSNCVIGAVKDFISYFHSDTQAKEFCASLAQDLQAVCQSTAESYYKSF